MSVGRSVLMLLLVAPSVAEAQLPRPRPGPPVPNPSPHYQCLQTDVQESPIGGGVKSIEVWRQTGNVPFMRLAYNRGAGWLDDSLTPIDLPDRYHGSFPINDPSKFRGIPGKSFLFRFYGQWSDNGAGKDFRVAKVCTATQTAIEYYNAYDKWFNVRIVITWDREYDTSLSARSRALPPAALEYPKNTYRRTPLH